MALKGGWRYIYIMSALRVILGDQLTCGLSALADIDRRRDVVLMMEVEDEVHVVAHHKQKLVLVFSAMRHFAAELKDAGIAVDYVRLEDAANTGNFTNEVKRALVRHRVDRLVLTQPSEWRVHKICESWATRFHLPVDMRSDTRFFCDRSRFAVWAKGRTTLRMEHFYREMRREHHLLMDGDKPAGGTWNFDAANRKRLPSGLELPSRLRIAPDAITREVMAMVDRRFASHFGTIDAFGWPVCRTEALAALEDFIEHGLPFFGDYQDAMSAGHPFVFHSLLAPALNIGLLTPREVCAAAEAAWRAGRAPLNAVEGFVRQILGWREYVRGVYWMLMPGYAEANALSATRALPSFYWTGATPMRCLAEAVGSTRDHAYSHHIQRLMITGNFALLAGVAPREIERWYLAVYADAFEWVEMPNTLGMAVFADGGKMASKPYAASGAYINRMSDFCGRCSYTVTEKTGTRACPFNYLYWAFLIRHEAILANNPRMAMPYRTLASWSSEQKQRCLEEAERFLQSLD